MPKDRHPPPTDFISLCAWIASTEPYSTLLDPASAIFPDVNDFTTAELEEALRYAIAKFQDCSTEVARLQHLKQKRRGMVNIRAGYPIEPEFTDRVVQIPHLPPARDLFDPGAIAGVPPTRDFWAELIITAKCSGDIRYQNCLLDLAEGIRRIKMEIRTLEGRGPEAEAGVVGDADDWFAVAEM